MLPCLRYSSNSSTPPAAPDNNSSDCPICLSKLPFSKRHRYSLKCCGNACCKACLKDTTGHYVLDWCPLCRSLLRHKKPYEQAKRLVLANSKTASTKDSLNMGIVLLRELLGDRDDDGMDETCNEEGMTLKLTLCKALYKQQTHESLQEAGDMLQKMIRAQLEADQKRTLLSFLFSRRDSSFQRAKMQKKLAQAHLLLAQVLEATKDENAAATNSPQFHYDQAVHLDPNNLQLLIACAKRSENATRYHAKVLQHNKYHVESNLAMAKHYQTYLQRQQAGSADANAILTSYLACLVRAEYQLGLQQKREQNNSANGYSSNSVSTTNFNTCQRHREYLQQHHSTFHVSITAQTMDRISAAFVPVTMVDVGGRP